MDRLEPKAHLLLGIVRFKQKRLDEAEAEIRKGMGLLRERTKVVMFHYHLGNVLYAKGDVEGAMREYRLEIANNPVIDPAAVTARARITEIERQR